MSFAPENEPLADPKALLHVPVGLVSPLWPLFAGAAVGGATWWWMTRWARPANLEAMFGAAAKAAEAAPEPIAFAEPALAMAEASVEAAAEAEPVLEAAEEAAAETAAVTIEAAPAPVLHALAEAPEGLAPVGGEAAPISPVLEAMSPEIVSAEAKPKARKKLAEAQPDDASSAD
jgi:hypothetical protein